MKQKNQQKRTNNTKKYPPLMVGMLWLLLLVFIGLAAWAGWVYWQEHRVQKAEDTVASKFKDINLESDSYQNNFFHAHVTYVVTENKDINNDIRRVVDANFMPCKQAGQRNTSAITYECNAAPEIDFATDDHLEISYTFKQYPADDGVKDVKIRRVGMLYDRNSGKRLGLGNLFKPDTSFLQSLSDLSRQALRQRFDALYYTRGIFAHDMERATESQAKNFSDFLLTKDEKLAIIFPAGKVAPPAEGPVTVELPADKLYDLFTDTTVGVFLPALRSQKEATDQLAQEAAAAQERSQELVGANRANIDCAKMKCIALSYDDGPYAPYGNRLLDVLKARKAVATFCMVGNRVANYAAEVKRVVEEKSEVCNHSWDHSDLTNLSDAAVAAQVQQTNQAIYAASGVYPKLMRPPYGAVNTRVLQQVNMPLAFWSVDTLDWKDRNPNIVYQRAIAGAKPGAVILMHEIHQTTIDAAARIIDELQRQGYMLVTVSELFGINKDNISQFENKKLFER